MNKSDLKINDIVKLRNEKMYMLHTFNGKRTFVSHVGGWNPLTAYTDSLKEDEGFGWYDIVEVRRPVEEYQLAYCHWEKAPIIWERKTPKKMTLSQVSEALGYEVEIINED